MDLDLLGKLCETPGVPGREERVRRLITKSIKGLFDEVRTDPMGSLICTRKPTTPSKLRKPTRVMIAAHMDEIGFYVRHVDDKGFVWINPAGGFDARNLFSRRVLVCCAGGDYEGVMNPGGKPLHISTPEERKKVPETTEFFIDLGMDARSVQRKVTIGDFAESPSRADRKKAARYPSSLTGSPAPGKRRASQEQSLARLPLLGPRSAECPNASPAFPGNPSPCRTRVEFPAGGAQGQSENRVLVLSLQPSPWTR